MPLMQGKDCTLVVIRADTRRPLRKAKGKKCGNTYISRKYRCSPDGSSPEPDGITPRRIRRVALTAGLLAGGALAGYAWSRDWDRRQSEARLISPARRKPDPEAGYLRQRRLAAFRRACGGRVDGVMTDLVAAAVDEVDRGKLAAGGAKLAVAGSVPRLGGYCQAATQIGERSASAKLYLHTNSETVFKVPLETQGRSSKERTSKLSVANVIKRSEYEALIQAQAHSVGVQTPAIRAFNRRTGVIAMEYADGYISLRDWATSGELERDRPRALQAMKALRDSMLKANLAGLVHQDLHPGNILVNPASSKIKIIDWGEAFSKIHKHPVYDTYAQDAGFTNGLNIDMEMVIRRSWRPFNMDDTAVHMWLVHHHRPLYSKIDNDEPFTLPMLQKYMSAWYRDVDRLVEWQQRNPGRIIRMQDSLL